jgi:hypothetical protein
LGHGFIRDLDTLDEERVEAIRPKVIKKGLFVLPASLAQYVEERVPAERFSNRPCATLRSTPVR